MQILTKLKSFKKKEFNEFKFNLTRAQYNLVTTESEFFEFLERFTTIINF